MFINLQWGLGKCRYKAPGLQTGTVVPVRSRESERDLPRFMKTEIVMDSSQFFADLK